MESTKWDHMRCNTTREFSHWGRDTKADPKDTENRKDTHNKRDIKEAEKDNTEIQGKDTEEDITENETKGKEEERAQPRDPREGQSSTENVTTVDSLDAHRERAQRQEKDSRETATHAGYRDTREYNVPSSHMGKGKEREG